MRWIVCLLLCWPSAAVTFANLDFYVEAEEHKRITDYAAELWYITNGTVNTYALSFSITIKSSIDTLHFVWQNKNFSLVVRYKLNVIHSPSEAMGNWSSSLGQFGIVPDRRQGFTVTLPCTGKADDEIDVTIEIGMTTGKTQLYDLKLKRKKICTKRGGDVMEETVPSEGKVAKEDSYFSGIEARIAPLSLNTKLLATLVTCFVLLIIVGFTVYFILRKSHKKNQSIALPEGGVLLPLDETVVDREVEGGGVGDVMYEGESARQSVLEGRYDYGTSQCETALHPPTALNPLNTQDVPTLLQDQNTFNLVIQQLAIDASLVQVHHTIASGTFSVVQRGVLTVDYPETNERVSEEVRIKAVKRGASHSQISFMFQEGLLLHAVQHENISLLIGCVFGPTVELPMLLYLNCAQHDNLRGLLESSNRKHFLPLTELIYLGLQALNALHCLHSHGILHKDIAARNCLVSSDLNLQLTDAALSRDLFPDDYNCLADNTNQPIKWMALESLTHFQFSAASDVWSFGVLLWELMSFGTQPFLEDDPFEISYMLKQGYRLEKPPDCPDFLFEQMTSCWKLVPAARPTVEDLINHISEFHSNVADYV